MNIKFGIVGAIVMAFTIALFALLDFQWVILHTWALIFTLLAQFVFFASMTAISMIEHAHNKVFLRSGIFSALFLYLVLTILMVVVFTVLFPIAVNIFVLIHLALIAFFAATTIMLLAFSKRLAAVDAKSHEAVGQTEAKRGGF